MNRCHLLTAFIIAFAASFLHYTTGTGRLSQYPKLMVVAFDGLRWDFVTEKKMPYLHNLTTRGAYSIFGLRNQLVTVTAPNFYTIATGLYEENHGIVGNEMFDRVSGRYYDIWNETGDQQVWQDSHDAFWYYGEPIWLTNERAATDRFSGGMKWPLADTQAGNGSISYLDAYAEDGVLSDWKEQFDKLLLWYTNDTHPINLGLFYVAYPDGAEHDYSIFSPQVEQVLLELDQLVQYMMDKLSTLPDLFQQLNIMITADHGHMDVFRDFTAIDVDNVLHPSEYIWKEKSFFPANDNISSAYVYHQLNLLRIQNPKFYLWCTNKDEIPECEEEVPDRFHLRYSPRTGPIVAVEYGGYVMYSSSGTNVSEIPPVFGNHGYSPDEEAMWPYFMAIGPAFKPNYMFDQQPENVDLYMLMCYILDIEPKLNDGVWDRIRHILVDEGGSTAGPTTPRPSTSAIASTATFAFLQLAYIFVAGLFCHLYI